MKERNLNPYLRKSDDELQEFLQFRKRGGVVRSKKGKGSYRRKSKHNKGVYEDG